MNSMSTEELVSILDQSWAEIRVYRPAILELARTGGLPSCEGEEGADELRDKITRGCAGIVLTELEYRERTTCTTTVTDDTAPDPKTMRQVMEGHLRAVLRATNGDADRAAKILGVCRKTIYNWKMAWGVE